MLEQSRCSMNVGHDAKSWTASSSLGTSIQLPHNWGVGMAGKWVRERVLMLVDQAQMDSVVSASLGSCGTQLLLSGVRLTWPKGAGSAVLP